jgi:nucleotide-binding universal stress UspA family protein
MTEPIVVGVDDTAASVTALHVAAAEAALRSRPLRIVHALLWPLPTFHMPEAPQPQDKEAITLLAQANNMVAAAVERVRITNPALTISADVIIGQPAPVLRAASRTAFMLIIGSRNLGTIDRLLMGSVSTHLAAHAACPVLVSRGRPNPSGNILLVLDETPPSSAAIHAAFEAAGLRGSGLDAMHTRRHHSIRLADHLPEGRLTTLPETQEDRVDASIADRPRPRAAVEAREQFMVGGVHHSMIENTKHAQLAVISQRHARFARALFPTTKRILAHHAHCPVLVVPNRHDAATLAWPAQQ